MDKSRILHSKSHTFRVPSSTSTNPATPPLSIHITQPNLISENLTLTTWTASIILASVLHRYHPTFPPKDSAPTTIPILELGAGTGVVGITAATLWSAHTVLTDLSPIVPGIQANVDLNRSTMERGGGSATTGTLDWSHPASLTISPTSPPSLPRSSPSPTHAHIILAADTIYGPEHPAMLTRTILHWLAPSKDSRVFIAYPLRVAYLEEIRELWQLLEEEGLEAMEEGKMDVGDEKSGNAETKGMWDDETFCEWSVWRWKRGLDRPMRDSTGV